MYAFITGPLLWATFAIFIGGSIYKIATMISMAKKERVLIPYMTVKHSFRSIFHWIIPFGGRNMRLRPIMTVVTFAFHLSLLLAPIFLMAHNVILEERWGFGLWTIPELLADIMTLIVIGACLFFLVRRLVAREVAYVTNWTDYLVIVMVLLPYLTGFIAHHQWIDYETTLLLHILFGEIMLIAIPFTRLSHMLYFFFTRAFMGSEFGAVRHARDW